MLKTNQKIKNKSDYFLNKLILILIIICNRTTILYGANNNWVEVSQKNEDIEYLDRISLNLKGKGRIEITTK